MNGPLHVGILLPTREQAINGTYAAAPLLGFARQAEALGFDSLWAGDSLTAHVAAGRLVLGLGSGFPMPETEEEFASVGAGFRGRVGRLDEITALWRTAWRAGQEGEPADFQGRYWQADRLDRLPSPATA
ncbi:LLM class flavin-dependent oxidoreductase, partial [Streptomyces sp. NRRL S-481]|uniref:LLM class flavin-dependent oxidoreductase n=1 Tax=Streptomyces sp. NRRL S-481 TaxID=1463911 RepID=UPI0004C84E04